MYFCMVWFRPFEEEEEEENFYNAVLQDYVSKLAGLLVSAEGDPDCEAGIAVQVSLHRHLCKCLSAFTYQRCY